MARYSLAAELNKGDPIHIDTFKHDGLEFTILICGEYKVPNIRKAQKDAMHLYEDMKKSNSNPVSKVDGKLKIMWGRFHDFDEAHVRLLQYLGVLTRSQQETHIWLTWNGMVLNPHFSDRSVAYFTSRSHAVEWAKEHAMGKNATRLQVKI